MYTCEGPMFVVPECNTTTLGIPTVFTMLDVLVTAGRTTSAPMMFAVEHFLVDRLHYVMVHFQRTGVANCGVHGVGGVALHTEDKGRGYRLSAVQQLDVVVIEASENYRQHTTGGAVVPKGQRPRHIYDCDKCYYGWGHTVAGKIDPFLSEVEAASAKQSFSMYFVPQNVTALNNLRSCLMVSDKDLATLCDTAVRSVLSPFGSPATCVKGTMDLVKADEQLMFALALCHGIPTLLLFTLQHAMLHQWDALFVVFGLSFYTIPKVTPLGFVYSTMGSTITMVVYFAIALFCRPPPDKVSRTLHPSSAWTSTSRHPPDVSGTTLFLGVLLWGVFTLGSFASVPDTFKFVDEETGWAWFSHIAGVTVFLLVITRRLTLLVVVPLTGA
ncbi:hypothetical protein B5M09_004900, partial [Aphanomyces astaci]